MTMKAASTTILNVGWKNWHRKAPFAQYEHNGAEDNADAHLKRTLMGREVVVAVTKRKSRFRSFKSFAGEFDGRRRKRVLVKIIGE